MKGLYRFHNSRVWWFRWTQGGKRYAVSLKTDDEALAITKARAILAEGLQLGVPSRLHIDSVITQYLRVAQERTKNPCRPETAKRMGYIIRTYARDMGIEFVGQITHGSISNWLDSFKRKGSSSDTIQTYARAIKTFVGWLEHSKLVRAGLHQELHVPDRSPTGRKNWLKAEECARVIAHSKDPTLSFVLYCGFHAGLRKNEIVQARVGWFDLEAGLLHVQNDPKSGFILKDRENRTVPLTADFKKFLDWFLVRRSGDEFVLHPEKTKGLGFYRVDFRKLFNNHIRRCGVRCTLHDMRRSFASNLVSHGVSIYKVARWLGDGVQVVERSYGHLAPADSDIDRLTAKVA
jgi:integrase